MGGLFANQMTEYYGFTEDELAFVLETSVVKVARGAKEKK
jgi:hypothetical protein